MVNLKSELSLEFANPGQFLSHYLRFKKLVENNNYDENELKFLQFKKPMSSIHV